MVVDTEIRRTALQPDKSFAVSAPAGSGKTSLLTQRVLKLLSLVEVPEEILCLTFTRKATGEMRQRIVDALGRANSDEAPEAEHECFTWQLARRALERNREKNWQLLQYPNRLRITTIDGYCRNLAWQLLLENGFSTQTEPLEQPHLHYRRAVDDLVLDNLEGEGRTSGAIHTLLQHLDNDLNRLEELLINLLEKRDQWLPHMLDIGKARSYLEGFLKDLIRETLEEFEQKLRPRSSDLALLADYAANNLATRKSDAKITACLGLTALPEPTPEAVDQWHGLCQLLITEKSEWRKDGGVNIKLGFPTAKDDPELGDVRKESFKDVLSWCREQSELLEIVADVQNLPPERYSDDQWQVLEALASLLPRLSAHLQLHFQEQGITDFTEITLAALRSLGEVDDPTDLTLKLDYRLKHILIDEFQDTSSIQFEILRRLTAGWENGDGRSLFIVGDGMQSLYGFRNANVGLFLEARSQPIGSLDLQPLDLQVNFRSQAGIIDWINQVFGQAFPCRDNIGRGAVAYQPALAVHSALEGDAVRIDAFYSHRDHRAEAEKVCQLIAEIRRDSPKDSIALLVRNRSHLSDIIPVLQRAGHSWRTADIDPLNSKMPVVDLLSLTRAMHSPANRIAWLSILRAPWCGLDLFDLCHLTNTRLDDDPPLVNRDYPLLLLQIARHREIRGISEEGQRILDRVAPVLAAGWQNRQRKSLRTSIEGIWIALGGPATLSGSHEYQYCLQYLDLLEQLSPSGQIDDWHQFTAAVDRLYARPDPAGDPLLQIMTIHKAKGLEFDHVIIPGLNRRGSPDYRQLMLWRERISRDGDNQLLIGPLQKTGSDKDPLYRHLQREANEKSRLENTRVIYVAATRAIKRLHLLFNIDEGKTPVTNSLLESLWPWMSAALQDPYHHGIRIHSVTQESHASMEKEAAVDLPALSTIRRLPSEWINTDMRERSKSTVPDIPEPQVQRQPQERTIEGDARHFGTVMHRILRQIVIDGLDQWCDDTIEERAPFWIIQLRQLGVIDTDAQVNDLKDAIHNILGDPTGRWLLDNGHLQSACELPLGFGSENHSGVVDRTFIDQGQRWIIDYKSSRPQKGQTLAAFLEEQKELHVGQLGFYANLFAQFDQPPLPIRTALYFPCIPHLEHVQAL